MRRILALLVILALIPLVCADPTADSLSVGSASGDPGATYVPVQVVITNVADGPIQGITLNVTYDSGVIELAAAAAGSDLPEDFLGNPLWDVKLGADKKCITMYTDDQSYALTNGTTGNILDLYFNVIGTAGQTSPIELSAVDVGSTSLVHGTIPTINGTFTVNGTVVDPVLCTTPDPPSNDFGIVPAGEPRTWTFDVTNCGGEGTLAWTVVDDQDWITVSPESGSDTGTVTVTIDTTGLAVGAHTGTITVGSSYGTKTGSISVTVPPDSVDPMLCTSPDPPSNDFGIVPAGEPRTWTFDVTNCGGEGTLAWTVVDDQDWITVSPESGSDTGTVTVTIDTAGLSDGAHGGTVTVNSGYGTKTGTIDVTVEPVTDPAPYLTTYTISGTEIDVAFSEPVDAAILIENATGVVRTLYTGSGVTDPAPQVWDETDDSGNTVADGMYQVNITMDDGVNPAVCDNARSIRVRTGPEVDVSIDCGIVYPHPYPGCSVTLPITLRHITDYGAGTVNLYYDASVVEVGAVTSSEGSSVESWNVVTPGWLIISALNTTGVSGDVVFANVVFNSVGNTGECSVLDLTVDTLSDIYYEELPYVTTNCSICIEDPYAPVVSKPSANPDTILNDNGRARVAGTNVSVLSVVVTDANGVASVTINLSSIWGPGNDSVPMTNVMGTDQWTVEVNAPYDVGVGQVHNLAVNATDISGNSNTAKTIELTVLRRGDVVHDNNVNMFDYLYIARYTVGLEPAPDELVAGIISADSHNGVNMIDALYIARHTVHLEPAP